MKIRIPSKTNINLYLTTPISRREIDNLEKCGRKIPWTEEDNNMFPKYRCLLKINTILTKDKLLFYYP